MSRNALIAIGMLIGITTSASIAEAQNLSPEQKPAQWWSVFQDPVLDDLMVRGTLDNTSIEEASARLAHAQASLKAAQADLYPQVGAAAAVTNQSGQLINDAGGIGTLFNTGLNFSFDLDLFGRLAKARSAANLEAKAGQALLASARLLTQAQIADVYFQIRGLDAERSIQRNTIKESAEAESIQAQLRQSGLISDVILARLRAEHRADRAELVALDQRRAELEHALAFLSGASADQFQLPESKDAARLPDVPSGIPSDLLRRRPDVVAAGFMEQSAKAKVEAAKLAWLPSFSLTGSGGLVSTDLASLFNPAAASFGLGGFLASVLFDGGRQEAGVMAAKEDDQLASAQYRTQVLNAFRDVKDQLTAVQSLNEQAVEQREILQQDEKATRLILSSFESGLADRLDVLVARRQQAQDLRQEEQLRARRFSAVTRLIKSLGGGWTAPQT
mgnify:CR=1 FL=1